MRAGIGLRAPHVADLLATRPALGWLEIHPENYFGGGAALRALEDLRRDYPVSLHGVGLSLGSADGVDAGHLARLASLIRRIAPCAFSEHLSWSVADGTYFNDLLPLPYTEETLAVVPLALPAWTKWPRRSTVKGWQAGLGRRAEPTGAESA